MLEVTVKVWGIMYSVLRKKKKGCNGKDLQKKKILASVAISLNLLTLPGPLTSLPYQLYRDREIRNPYRRVVAIR